jgi:hypothetical protein
VPSGVGHAYENDHGYRVHSCPSTDDIVKPYIIRK